MDKRELTEIIARATCHNLAKLAKAAERRKRRDLDDVTPLDTWGFAEALAERLLISYELKRRPPTPPHGAP